MRFWYSARQSTTPGGVVIRALNTCLPTTIARTSATLGTCAWNRCALWFTAPSISSASTGAAQIPAGSPSTSYAPACKGL